MVVKSANRTFSVTVRPATPAVRIRPATFAESRSTSRTITSRSSVSRPKVSSAPMVLSGSSGPRRGVMVRWSSPQASACRWDPSDGPRARRRVVTGVCARSPTVISPSRLSSSAVFSPTPHSSPTSSGCRKEVTACGGTTTTPSGLAARLAILATVMLAATPTEQVMPCSS